MSRQLSESILFNQALFAALPAAAREEVGKLLGDLSRDILELQKRLVPVYTGERRKGKEPGRLKAALTIAEAINALRVRIGLPTEKLSRRSRLFYAVIQHYGRKAQTVTVTRGRTKKGLAPYQMRVPAMAGIPFVHVEGSIDALIEGRLAGFWDRVQTKAGA